MSDEIILHPFLPYWLWHNVCKDKFTFSLYLNVFCMKNDGSFDLPCHAHAPVLVWQASCPCSQGLVLLNFK
jgi:hypothetical protein